MMKKNSAARGFGAARAMRRGQVFIYTTETAFALGADPFDAAAVRKVFKIKGRARVKTLPLIASSLAQAKKFAVFDAPALKIAKKFWPGPLTLVLPARGMGGAGSAHGAKKFAAGIVVPDGTLAIRVSSNKLARSIARKLGRPVVSTSANKSGEPEIFAQKNARKVSTIIKIQNKKIILIRKGAVPFSKIARAASSAH